jgi:hypothetical protein
MSVSKQHPSWQKCQCAKAGVVGVVTFLEERSFGFLVAAIFITWKGKDKNATVTKWGLLERAWRFRNSILMETLAIRGYLRNHPENYPALYHVSRFWMDLLEAVRRRFVRRFFFERDLALDDDGCVFEALERATRSNGRTAAT